MITVRPLKSTKELDQYNDSMSSAYRFNKSEKNDIYDPDKHGHIRACFNDYSLVCALALLKYSTYIGGKTIPMGGIGGVATLPEEQGKGYARTLVLATIAEMNASGYAVSTLYPVSYKLYRKFGYELAGKSLHYSGLCQHDFRACEEARLVRRAVLPEDSKIIADCYNAWSARYNGMLVRSKEAWDGKFAEWKNRRGQFFIVEEAGKCIGFFNSLTADLPEHRFISQTTEIYLLNERAIKAFVGFMAMMPSNVKQITIDAPVYPSLWNLLDEPTVPVAIKPLCQFRIVNIERAFSLRGYPLSAIGSIIFSCSDDTAPWNNGTWKLSVDNGSAKISKTSEKPYFSLDQHQLVRLYVGTASLAELAFEGAAIITNNNAFKMCDDIFGNQMQYIADFF